MQCVWNVPEAHYLESWGDVRGFDAKTGRQVWSFHTVPGAGEPGVETWGDESWKITGHTNA